jgi:hypothetical protein
VNLINIDEDRDTWQAFCDHGNEHSGCIKSEKYLHKTTVLLASQLGLVLWSTEILTSNIKFHQVID